MKRNSLVFAALVATLVLAGAAPLTASGQSSVPVCTVPDKSFDEGSAGGAFGFALEATCDAPFPQQVEFHVKTADGTAVAPDDYVALDTTLSRPEGDTVLGVTLEIVADAIDEPDESFTVTLDDPSGAVTFAKPTATITILDDDAAPPPPGACIMLSETSVSVSGTASTPSHRGVYGTNPDRLTITNCGTAPVHLGARGTDATGAARSWRLADEGTGSTCDLGLNVFRAVFGLLVGPGGGVGIGLSTRDRFLVDADGTTPFTLAAGAAQDAFANVEMPCVGSIGLGDPMTTNVTLTAVAP
jgi:Calx-beta domain-containing protein